MSGRVSGKGRILGTHQATQILAQSSNSSASNDILASSDSAVSRTSSSLSGSGAPDGYPSGGSLLSQQQQDVTANVVNTKAKTGLASASSRLLCPICSEQMVTLLQLNRHLDDVHDNLEEVQQDEVKNWFQSQVDKAKKLPALDFLEKKFRALDVFEANLTAAGPGRNMTPSLDQPGGAILKGREMEEEVTRKHWQKARYSGDLCSDPTCGKYISGSGAVNCRCCGKLFCEEHAMYQIKLARTAHHDPVRGTWCRVCETCYKSRAGYNDTQGYRRDHTKAFSQMRSRTVDRLQLETNRLEKRLSRLTQLLANPPAQLSSSGSQMELVWGFATTAKSQQRMLEQSVIDWQDDASVSKCPFCQQDFSSYTFRRHHCRLCGRVVCGDATTLCSTLVPLNVAVPVRAEAAEKACSTAIGMNVRMCKDCRHTLFSKADLEREAALKPIDQRSYEHLCQFERGIRLLLPKFHKLLVLLQDPDKAPTQMQITEATKVRKRLTDSFVQYNSTARRIRDFTTTSPTQLRLQKAVYLQASNFLHLHMLPLKSLPSILKHASPHGMRPSFLSSSSPYPSFSDTTGNSTSLAPIHARASDRTLINLDNQSTTSASSAALESVRAEEQQLKQRLMVLEEQRFLVQEMLAGARKARRLEEMTLLSRNLDDLNVEIDCLTATALEVEGEFWNLLGDAGT